MTAPTLGSHDLLLLVERPAVVAVDVPPAMVEALFNRPFASRVVPLDLSRPVGGLLDDLQVLRHDDEGDESIVLVHDGSRTASVAAAHLRALAPPGTVVLVALKLPPLARACVGLLVAELAQRMLPASLLATVARATAQELYVWARLVSVARLRSPAPTMAQHLRSYLPGSSFLATVQPSAGVVTWSAHAVRDLPAPSADSLLVTCSLKADGGVEQFQAHSKAQTVTSVPPDPSSSGWWGSRSVAEAVVVPPRTTLGRLAQTVLDEAFCCRWCRRAVRDHTCPACGMLQAHDPALPS